jgi:hypothetical protein
MLETASDGYGANVERNTKIVISREKIMPCSASAYRAPSPIPPWSTPLLFVQREDLLSSLSSATKLPIDVRVVVVGIVVVDLIPLHANRVGSFFRRLNTRDYCVLRHGP